MIDENDLNLFRFFSKLCCASYHLKVDVKVDEKHTFVTQQLNLNSILANDYEIINFNNEKGFFAFSEPSNKRLIFLFKGTSFNIEEWKANIDLALGKYPSSFIEDAKKFYTESVNKVKEDYKVFVTGHSLGAYIAECLALSFENVTAVTFDSPGHFDNSKTPENIHTIVSMPNLVNTVGFHIGKLYFLELSEEIPNNFLNSLYKKLENLPKTTFFSFASASASSSAFSSRMLARAMPIIGVACLVALKGIFEKKVFPLGHILSFFKYDDKVEKFIMDSEKKIQERLDSYASDLEYISGVLINSLSISHDISKFASSLSDENIRENDKLYPINSTYWPKAFDLISNRKVYDFSNIKSWKIMNSPPSFEF